jgi:hypothetical protein
MNARDELIEVIDSVKRWVPGQDVHRYEASPEATADAIIAAGFRKWEPQP